LVAAGVVTGDELVFQHRMLKVVQQTADPQHGQALSGG
jgi:hypothetical protein